MKPMEKISGEEADKLVLMFEIAPRLADAYRLKNEFLDVIHSDSSETGKQKLIDWLMSVEVMDLPEFSDCTKAYRNWFCEILNSLDVPWPNGFIEGCNNKTKVSKMGLLRYAKFLEFQKKNSVLPYIEIVPELYAPTQPNFFVFVSTPTIDIEPYIITLLFSFNPLQQAIRISLHFLMIRRRGTILAYSRTSAMCGITLLHFRHPRQSVLGY